MIMVDFRIVIRIVVWRPLQLNCKVGAQRRQGLLDVRQMMENSGYSLRYDDKECGMAVTSV